MSLVSDIKLIRTDTTLDLSQKAEKGMLLNSSTSPLIARSWCWCSPSTWDKLTSPFDVFLFHIYDMGKLPSPKVEGKEVSPSVEGKEVSPFWWKEREDWVLSHISSSHLLIIFCTTKIGICVASWSSFLLDSTNSTHFLRPTSKKMLSCTHPPGRSLPLIFCIHVRSGPIYWGGILPCKKDYKVMVFYM